MISYRKIEPRITYRNLNLSEVENFQDVATFPFTANAGVGGTITPSSFDAPIDSLVAVAITPDDGYVFVRALVNGVETQSQSFALKMEKAYTVVAEFEQGAFKTLNVSKIGVGTLLPDVGSYQKNEGEVVPVSITAVNTQDESDKGIEWYAEGVMVDGVESFDNPADVVMDENHDVTGVFKTYDQQLKVFDSAPVLRGNKYYFGDHSTKDNDVLIKNVKVGTFGTAQYIAVGVFLVGGEPYYFRIIYKPRVINVQSYLNFGKSTSAAEKGILVYRNAANNLLILISNGTNQQTYTVCPLGLQVNDIAISWNGTIGGTITVTVNGNIFSTLATHSWSGNSSSNIIGYAGSSIDGIVSYVKVNIYEYIFNHGQGAVIYDTSGNGNNGTLTGAVLSTFWGTNSDEAIPYDTILGATLYQNNSDSTIMPICFNTSQAITGFTRLGWFPAGSGILRGLPNTYNLPIAVGTNPAGDYTAEQIANFATDEYVLKTSDTNTVSSLKVRSKQP